MKLIQLFHHFLQSAKINVQRRTINRQTCGEKVKTIITIHGVTLPKGLRCKKPRREFRSTTDKTHVLVRNLFALLCIYNTRS